MTSAIDISQIDTTFPVPGRDNDSQGFRTNFGAIRTGLATAKDEITLLKANKADLIEISLFSNSTNATSTSTGALVVTGGVGIGGDLYVGGKVYSDSGDSINTGTTAPSVQTGDLLFSGTYGRPNFSLRSTIVGDKEFLGTISAGRPNPGINAGTKINLIYAGSTATYQTGLYIRGFHNNFTNVTLDTFKGDGSSGQTYLKFVKSPGNINTTTIASFALGVDGDSQGSKLCITGDIVFKGNLTVEGISTLNATQNTAGVASIDAQTGTVVLANLASFANSTAPTEGYQKLPGGIIMQWGYQIGGSSKRNVVWPTPFTTAVYSVTATPIMIDDISGVPTSIAVQALPSITSSTFSISADYDGFYWTAIGK